MFCFQPNNNLLIELKFILLLNLTTCLWSLFLYAREIHLSFLYAFFLINPAFLKPILSKLKSLRSKAKLSICYSRIK